MLQSCRLASSLAIEASSSSFAIAFASDWGLKYRIITLVGLFFGASKEDPEASKLGLWVFAFSSKPLSQSPLTMESTNFLVEVLSERCV